MLLDVVSERVPDDVATGSLNLLLCHQRNANEPPSKSTTPSPKHSIVVVSGEKDPTVPIGAVRSFVNGMKTKALEERGEETDRVDDGVSIEMVEIEKGDHGLLAQSVDDPGIGKTHKKTTDATIERVIMFLKRCGAVEAIQ